MDGLAVLLLGFGVALTCLAFVHASPSDAYWTGDCANKALVAERLLETSFRDPRFDYPAAELDPEHRAFPLPDLAVRQGDAFISVFPLTYPALAAPFLAALGPAGLRWPAALGVGACAGLLALWLMPVVGRRVALTGGATLALATPLFFYGVTVWEHSLTIACFLLAAVLLRRPGPWLAFQAGLVLGLAVWLREELALLGLAVACVELLRRRDPPSLLALCLGGGLCGVGLAVFNTAVYGSMLGPHTAALDPGLALRYSKLSALATRVASLVVGRTEGVSSAWGLAAVAAGAILAGAIAEWRGWGRRVALVAAVATGTALWALAMGRILQGPPLPALVSYNGLVPQIPLVCLAGIGAVRVLRDDAWEPLRPAVLAGLLFLVLATIAGIATHSVFGMGLHVSPRKLLPVLPVWVTLALAAVWAPSSTAGIPARAALRTREAGAAIAVLLGVGAVSSVVAGYLLFHQKSEAAGLQDALRARPERFAVSGDGMLTQALTGIWKETPLLYTNRPPILREVVGRMRDRRVRRFLVLAPESTSIQDPALPIRCRRVHRHRGSVIGYWDTDILSCTVLRLPRRGRSPGRP